ncbi:MAG: outer membrane lipoprotein-sorting protein [Proteobacteria bacterium]|nr:outer membrane lipoprotein-sorting protein [Pseudomonadota bacterium]
MSPAAVRGAFLLALACLAASAWGQTGRELIEESLRRQAQPPYVYEEQVLVLSDSLGQYTVRTVRYYARQDASGMKRLLVIDTPKELRGLKVYVSRDSGGGRHGPAASSLLFGSDFSVADFEGEQPQDFEYEREANQELERVTHFVVRAMPKDESVARATGYGIRRIYLRKDNLFVSRVDYLDRQGRLARRLTYKDPRPDDTGAWRPGMTLNEDLREDRRTLLKVERRVHSADYVPAAVFEGHP